MKIKLLVLWLIMMFLSSAIATLLGLVQAAQNAELIAQVDYLKALIEENGGGR